MLGTIKLAPRLVRCFNFIRQLVGYLGVGWPLDKSLQLLLSFFGGKNGNVLLF